MRSPPTLRFLGPEPDAEQDGYSLVVDTADSAPMSVAPMTFSPMSDVERHSMPLSMAEPASRALMGVRERIANRARIATLISVLVGAKRKGRIIDARGSSCLLSPDDYDPDARTIRWSWLGPSPFGDAGPEAPIVLEIDGYQSIFRQYVDRLVSAEGGVVTTLPEEMIRYRRRRLPGVRAPRDSSVDLQFAPAIAVPNVAVLELSFGGLRVALPTTGVENLRKGMRGRAVIRTPGRGATEIAVQIKSATRPGPSSANAMRLRVVCSTDDERHAWNQLVLSIAHPATATAGCYCDAIWRLYQRAGYFNLSGKDSAQFERLERCFRENTARLEAAPQLGSSVVWPDRTSDDVVAAMNIVRLYGGTVIAYQLAKVTGTAPDGTPSRDVLRDVHMRAYGPVLRDSRVRWLLSHIQVKRVWSRAVHHDLPERYVGTGHAAVVRFRAIELACDAPSFSVVGTDVRPAASHEIERLLDWLERERPEPYRGAHDLTRERIDFRETRELWRSARLARDRELWVATDRGEVVAAAVLEDAQEGMHLFRLFEAMRVFPLVADLGRVRRGTAALIKFARGWYRARDKNAFCAFVEQDDWIDPMLTGPYTDMGLADASIVSAELLPEFLEQLCEITAPRGD